MTKRWSHVTILLLLCSFAPPLWAEGYPSRPEQRMISLKGTRNTRDLGGLPVLDGTFPKGKVIRSGALCFASIDDAAKLHGMQIQTIIELRLANEIAKDGPDKAYLLKGVPRQIHWPMASSRGPGLAAYQTYVAENGPLFHDFFALLAQPESYPVLFHCSAGKDRTGILAAMLLDLLGTPRDVIYDDYLHSMRITEKLKVDQTWLDAVFEVIDNEGGIEPFLKARGVSEQQISSVRANLLTR